MKALRSGGRRVLTVSHPLIPGGVGHCPLAWPASCRARGVAGGPAEVPWGRADPVSGSGLAEAFEMASGCRGPRGRSRGPRQACFCPAYCQHARHGPLLRTLFPEQLCVYEVTSVLSDSVTPWTVARQAPGSMGFSRQEYSSESPCPPPGGLPDPGLEPGSLMSPALAGGFFTTSTTCLLSHKEERI